MEIKFRAWDNENKRLLSWWDICSYYNLLSMLDPMAKNHDRYEVMQYTGLKDRNGKEIYEGDIVVWNKYNGMGLYKIKYQIVWFEDEAGFRGISLEDNPSVLNLNNSRVGLEVIGNIYENPELLEVEK